MLYIQYMYFEWYFSFFSFFQDAGVEVPIVAAVVGMFIFTFFKKIKK